MWFNCNPDGPYHWFKQNWINKCKEKNLLYLHFTMDDNLSLSEKIKVRYRSMYTGVFYKRYILGMWAVAEGIIYDMFSEEEHVVKKEEIKLINNPACRYVSCDYGTQNATVFLLWNKAANGKWYCIKEYYYSGRKEEKQKTDAEYADDLKGWLGDTGIKAIIVDPSAASFIAELRKRKYKVLKAKNDVLDGIRLVATLLNLKKLFFCDTAVNVIQEFQSYSWDEKAAERGEDKPIKQHDHAVDAVRYFCYTILNQTAKMKTMKG